MGGFAGFSSGENLGIPSDLQAGQAVAGGLRRKGLLQALMGVGQGMSDPGAQPEQPAASSDHRFEDDKSRSPYGDVSAMTPPAQASPDRPMAPVNSGDDPYAPLKQQIQQMQGQYDQMNQPAQRPGIGHRLIQGIANALGGNPYMQRQQQQQEFEENQKDTQRNSLLQQITANQRTLGSEQTADKRLGQQMQLAHQHEGDVQAAEAGRDQRLADTIKAQGDRATQQQASQAALATQAQAAQEQRLQEQIKAQGENVDKKIAAQGNREVGTWTLEEDAQGKPMMFNSKTGATRAAPPGMNKPGTYQKAIGGGEESLQYANDYMTGGRYTGTGDEALMEKFFDLAKPSSGFRMTQPQIEMLTKARDAQQGLTAQVKHYLSPEAPYFDDQQRKNIVKTMNDIINAKREVRGGGGSPAPSSVQEVTATGPGGHKIAYRGGRWVDMPQAAIQSSSPPPPPGYTLDSVAGSGPPTPPPGYTLDSQAQPQTKPPQYPTGPGNAWRQQGVSDDAPPGSATAIMRGGYEQHEEDPNLAHNSLKYAMGSAAATAGAASGPGMLARGGAAVGGTMRAHPVATTIGLDLAKQIPGIGPYLSKIPGWLPLVLGGKGGGGAAEAEGATEAEQVARPKLVEQIQQRTTAAEPYPTKPLNFPPDEPTGKFQSPAPNPRADLIDDQGVQQDMRGYLDRQDRQVHAFEPVGRSKGDMTDDFNQATGRPPASVTLTKTPSLKAKVAAGKPPQATTDEDLEPILRESLKAAMRKKGNQ